MPTFLLYSPSLILAIGALMLWVNPRRRINQVFALVSLIATFWLYCVFMAIWTGLHEESGFHAVPWVRALSAVGAFLPMSILLMKESILSVSFTGKAFTKRALAWFLIGCFLASLCYTKTFAFDPSGSENRARGLGYLVYSITSFSLYLLLTFQTYKQWRQQVGVSRLELQFLILNAGIACILAVVVSAVGN